MKTDGLISIFLTTVITIFSPVIVIVLLKSVGHLFIIYCRSLIIYLSSLWLLLRLLFEYEVVAGEAGAVSQLLYWTTMNWHGKQILTSLSGEYELDPMPHSVLLYLYFDLMKPASGRYSRNFYRLSVASGFVYHIINRNGHHQEPPQRVFQDARNLSFNKLVLASLSRKILASSSIVWHFSGDYALWY